MNKVEGLGDTDPKRGDWCCTYSGKQFFFSSPHARDISIRDIAHHLSNLCRFGGATRRFYSVAQHCVLVSDFSIDHPLDGLLHDASEAYLIDIPRPIKVQGFMRQYRDVDRAIEIVIRNKFVLNEDMPDDVKMADGALLATEARDLMQGHKQWLIEAKPLAMEIIPWSPEVAEDAFIRCFERLANTYQMAVSGL